MSGTTSSASIAAPSTSSSATSTSGTSSLASLANNFNDFLNLLLTQLKNQDPTSPLDTNQFTSQIVQFTSVQEQINTNASLNSLIQLTQSGQLLQSATLVGHQVAVTSDHVPLQNGSATVDFTPAAAGPVTLTVSTEAGVPVATATVNATAGANTWTWNGQSSGGVQLPDGSYRIAVSGAAAGGAGAAAAVPFTVVGTATGLQRTGSALQLQLGALSVDMSAVQSLVN